MESYRFGSYDEAIEMLQRLKKKGKSSKVLIFTFDYDKKSKIPKRTLATPDYGCALVKKSKTIIINEDEYIPHMQLFSENQNDLENIMCKGIMHDIIVGHKNE